MPLKHFLLLLAGQLPPSLPLLTLSITQMPLLIEIKVAQSTQHLRNRQPERNALRTKPRTPTATSFLFSHLATKITGLKGLPNCFPNNRISIFSFIKSKKMFFDHII